MSIKHSLILLSAVIWGNSAAYASECHPPVPVSDMKLTFDEEFKGDSIDRQRWNVFPHHAGDINGEVQAYVPDALEMMPGGGLRIRADRHDFDDKHFTSGIITTAGGFSQAYGHFEMKAKMPGVNGAWPAFWLLPESGAWPPEIDIVEYIHYLWGHVPEKYAPSNAHFGLFWDPKLSSVTWKPPGNSPWKSNSEVYLTDNYKTYPKRPLRIEGDMSKDYHVYAVDWRPHELSFSVDGHEGMCWIEGDDTRDTVPDVPMYMIVNLALAAEEPKNGWSGHITADQEFPFSMDIAYIRAYQFKDAPKVAQAPLTMGIPVLSSDKVKPGDDLTITTDFKTGAADIESVTATAAITNFNGKQAIFHDSPARSGKIEAHSQYPYELHYHIPDDMKPGIYLVHIRGDYPGGRVDSNLATEFTVIEP